MNEISESVSPIDTPLWYFLRIFGSVSAQHLPALLFPLGLQVRQRGCFLLPKVVHFCQIITVYLIDASVHNNLNNFLYHLLFIINTIICKNRKEIALLCINKIGFLSAFSTQKTNSITHQPQRLLPYFILFLY